LSASDRSRDTPVHEAVPAGGGCSTTRVRVNVTRTLVRDTSASPCGSATGWSLLAAWVWPRSRAARQLTDQWTTDYGGGTGLIVYERQRVIILPLE